MKLDFTGMISKSNLSSSNGYLMMERVQYDPEVKALLEQLFPEGEKGPVKEKAN